VDDRIVTLVRVGSVLSFIQTMATNGRHLAKAVRLVKA
jgi:hypothetical protein